MTDSKDTLDADSEGSADASAPEMQAGQLPGLKQSHPSKRVALLHWESSAITATDWAGLAVSEWARGLQRLGHDVHVFTRGDASNQDLQEIDGVIFHILGAEVAADRLICAEHAAAAFCSSIQIEESKNGRFEIIHAHGWMTIPALDRLKRMHDYHSLLTMFSIEASRTRGDASRELSRAISGLEQHAVGICKRIMVLDQGLCEQIITSYAAFPKCIEIIKSGFDDSRFEGPVDPVEVKARYNIGPDEDLVLFVGELSDDCGALHLLEGLSQLFESRDRARVIVVGDGEQYWPLKVRAHYLGIEHLTCMPGHREGREVYDLYRAADLLVAPGAGKSSRTSIICGLAAGTPVVASISAGRNLIDDQVNGILVEPQARTLAQAIYRVLGDKQHSSKLAHAGRETVKRRFSWDLASRELSHIYANL